MYMCIGLNSGVVVVGNMGLLICFNYMMMGDMVNFVVWFESGVCSYGVGMLVMEVMKNVVELVGDWCVFCFFDWIVVKGCL